MSLHPLRFALAATTLLALAGAAHSQTDAPPPAVAAPVVSTPPAGEPQDTAEAKLAIALRSYTLVSNENDELRNAQEKLQAENSSLQAQLAIAKAAIPVADQAAALREQLRQTQDQLAALALENSDLRTKLALATPPPGQLAPTSVAAPLDRAPAPPPPAPAGRTHVVVAGDTLTRISKLYYGTPDRWKEILAANHDVLRDEKNLVVGRTLKIP